MFLTVEAEERREGGKESLVMMMMEVGDSQNDYQSGTEFNRKEQNVSKHFYQLGVPFCWSVFL
jgi:hypothetical protein